MATLKQRVQKVIAQNKRQAEPKLMPADIAEAWHALSSKQQTWLSLSMTQDEMNMLQRCLYPKQGPDKIEDLLYQIKHFATKESLAQKFLQAMQGE